MRIGCLGCLTMIFLVALLTGTVWMGLRAFQEPALVVETPSESDGVSAQKKLLDLARGRTPKSGPVLLSQNEINAFLGRHLAESTSLTLAGMALRLRDDGALEFKGSLPLRRVVGARRVSGFSDVVPSGWLDRSVWLRFRARPRVEQTKTGRRYLYLDVERFAVGRQPLPTLFLRLLLDPVTLRMLAWPLPAGIGSLKIEAGQVVLLPAS